MFAVSDHSLSLAPYEMACGAAIFDNGGRILHVKHTVRVDLRRDDPLVLIAERRLRVQRTEDSKALSTARHMPHDVAGPGRWADQHRRGAAAVSRRRFRSHRADAGQAQHLCAAIVAKFRSQPRTDAGRNAGAGMFVQRRSPGRNRPHPGGGGVYRVYPNQRHPRQDRRTRHPVLAAHVAGAAAGGVGDTGVRATLIKSLAVCASSVWAVCGDANPRHSLAMATVFALRSIPNRGARPGRDLFNVALGTAALHGNLDAA